MNVPAHCKALSPLIGAQQFFKPHASQWIEFQKSPSHDFVTRSAALWP